MNLGKHETLIKSGKENFHQDGKSLNFNLISFWSWSNSQLLGNTLRGILAEYIVSMDIGCKSEMRDEWDSYDLVTIDGTKVEVKSGSYLQSWEQKKLSSISFGIQKTYGWDYENKRRHSELKRQADIYVFCVLAHKDKRTVDPMNMDQWDFYVLSSKVLNERVKNQKSISLSSLLKLEPIECKYGNINKSISILSV